MKLSKDGKKGKRKKTSNVKRPTTAYLYFVSKYREKIKAAGEPMPKVYNSCLDAKYLDVKNHRLLLNKMAFK